jgi:hypothetical protein
MIRLAILASLLAGIASAAEPLVKPASPAAGFIRVTYPLTGGDEAEGTAYAIAGFVTPFKLNMDKNSPGTAVRVGLGSSSTQFVTVATLKKWGYIGVAGEKFTLPSLTLVGEAKVQGKPCTVHVKFTKLVMEVVKSAYGSEDDVNGADLMIDLNQTLLAKPGQSELWMTFNEGATLKVSYPASAVRKIDTAEEHGKTETAVDPNRVPLRIAFDPQLYWTPIVSFNGQPVNAKAKVCSLMIGMTSKDYANLTMPMARIYNLKPDESKEKLGNGPDTASKLFPAQSKNLCLAGTTGAGWKAPLDLNLKDVTVTIATESEYPILFLGPSFFKGILKSPVLAVGTDGIPRLYGYAEKDATKDPRQKK